MSVTSPLEHPSESIAGPLVVALEPLRDPAALGDLWSALEGRATASPFQSWPWVATWLTHLPEGLDLRLLRIEDDTRLVGLGVIVVRRRPLLGRFARRRLYLNETGDPRIDPLALEYNGLLIEDSAWEAAIAAMLTALPLGRLDEMHLGGLVEKTATLYQDQATALGFGCKVKKESPCAWVDLARVRQDGGRYLDRLSRNTRQRLAQALRTLETLGPMSLRVAEDRKDALKIFHDLKQLHQASWKARGKTGAFANSYFEAFHRDLIDRLYPEDGVQLVRLCLAERTLGCLYNLVKDGQVYAYQSGFDYTYADIKPGYLSHTLAIEENLRRGAEGYHFMAGEAQYKRSLATANETMRWLVLRSNGKAKARGRGKRG